MPNELSVYENDIATFNISAKMEHFEGKFGNDEMLPNKSKKISIYDN